MKKDKIVDKIKKISEKKLEKCGLRFGLYL